MDWMEVIEKIGFPAGVLFFGGLLMWKVLSTMLPTMTEAVRTHVAFVRNLEKLCKQCVTEQKILREQQKETARKQDEILQTLKGRGDSQ